MDALHLWQMQQRLLDYEKELSLKDILQSLALLPVLMVAALAMFGGAFGGVGLLVLAAMGKVSAGVGVLALIAGVCGFVAMRKANPWMERVLCAAWAASALKQELRLLTKFELRKYQKLALGRPARAFVEQLQTQKLTPRHFHLQALRAMVQHTTVPAMESAEAEMDQKTVGPWEAASGIASTVVIGLCVGALVVTAVVGYLRPLL
jgi:hypothetical protein